MARIRRYEPTDQPALAAICLRTADAGGDATGMLTDDEIWANLFVLPYVARDPTLAWIVESDDGHAAGYLVATDDTDAFEVWFRQSWWPRFAERWPAPTDKAHRQKPAPRDPSPQNQPAASQLSQDQLLGYAYGRGTEANPHAADYPSHLHIDLLPEVRGQGWGRQLMELLAQSLRERGALGIQIGAIDSNAAALAFYGRLGFSRIGFTPIGGDSGVVVLGKRL